MDLKIFIEELQDHLAPSLDIYDLAIYLYIFRHTRLLGNQEGVIGFKSARKQMSYGRPKGEGRTRMSDYTCMTKLKSLEQKGFVKILETERTGTRIQLFLPSEIPNLITKPLQESELDLEEMDFFNVPKNRQLILKRDKHKCFYCLKKLSKSNYVIEHVVSRPEGSNSYRNLVASCLDCNYKKKNSAEEHLRYLYRDERLSSKEFDQRLNALEQLRQGLMKPDI